MKTCTSCYEVKVLDEFGPCSYAADKLSYQCRKCLAKRQAKWRADNPKRAAEIEHKSWTENQRFSKHGLTKETWQQILDLQGGVCAICRLPGEDGPKKGLFVDHDHSCCPGKFSCGECVRGLLHMKCNTAIGYFNDDPELLLAAALYLQSPPVLVDTSV